MKQTSKKFIILTIVLAFMMVIPSINAKASSYDYTIEGIKRTISVINGETTLTVGDKSYCLTRQLVAADAALDQNGTAWILFKNGAVYWWSYELEKDSTQVEIHKLFSSTGNQVYASKFLFEGADEVTVTGYQTSSGSKFSILTLEELKIILFGNSTGNSGNTGNTDTNTGSDTDNSGNTGNTDTNTGSDTDNSGSTGNTDTNTGSNTDNSGSTGNTDTNTGSNTDNSGSTGNTDTNTDSNTGNSGSTGNTDTNTGSNTGNSGSTGNTDTNTGSNTGNSGSTGNTNTNTGSNTNNSVTTTETSSSTRNDYNDVKVTTTTTTTTTIDSEGKTTKTSNTSVKTEEIKCTRVVHTGSYYKLYSNKKRLTIAKLKKGKLTWRGYTCKGIKTIGFVKESKNLIVITKKGKCFTLNYDDMTRKYIIGSKGIKQHGKAVAFNYDKHGFVTHVVTKKPKRIKVTNR